VRALRLALGAWGLATMQLGAQSDTLRTQRVRTVDEWMAQAVRRPAWVRTGFGHDAARVVSDIGGTGTMIAGALLWGAGELQDNQSNIIMGRSATQAFFASSLLTGTLKFTFGRARPYVTADTNSRSFRLGRGWNNDAYRSFPSGHSTAAFAFAAALSQERARLRGRSGGFDAAVYGGAGLVAISRMMLDRHWLSDVLVGAAIGTAGGILTVRLAH
jgi:membrane-associated phospholipid phosphatase